MKKIFMGMCLGILFSLNSAFALHIFGTPNGDALLAKVVKGFEKVRDFTVTLHAEVNMERVQIPQMNAIMYFKRPDKIHLSSESFLMVPRDGISLNPAILAERYDAALIGYDTSEGQRFYKLQLAAKDKKTKLRQMYVWVHPEQWVIAKIETIPYEGRTLSMVFSYEFLQEGLWLPYKIVMTLGSTKAEEPNAADAASSQTEHFGHRERQMPKNGSVIIHYLNYKINAGIADSVFVESIK